VSGVLKSEISKFQNSVSNFQIQFQSFNLIFISESINKLGHILKSTVPYFKLYATYSSNYEKAIKTSGELVNVDWFQVLFPQLLKDKYLFDSLLITPIQRIPR
jgi:hypothetical protein